MRPTLLLYCWTAASTGSLTRVSEVDVCGTVHPHSHIINFLQHPYALAMVLLALHTPDAPAPPEDMHVCVICSTAAVLDLR